MVRKGDAAGSRGDDGDCREPLVGRPVRVRVWPSHLSLYERGEIGVCARRALRVAFLAVSRRVPCRKTGSGREAEERHMGKKRTAAPFLGKSQQGRRGAGGRFPAVPFGGCAAAAHQGALARGVRSACRAFRRCAGPHRVARCVLGRCGRRAGACRFPAAHGRLPHGKSPARWRFWPLESRWPCLSTLGTGLPGEWSKPAVGMQCASIYSARRRA